MNQNVFTAEVDQLQRLLDELNARGYVTIAPVVRDGAIVLDQIHAATDLPIGIGEDQEAGRYRLRPRPDEAAFGHTVGPQSWKRLLFPPDHRLWTAARDGRSFAIRPRHEKRRPLALFGVRPCDLAAIGIQDRIFHGDEHVDPHYAGLRSEAVIVVVNCTEAAPTCFCASMGTGPRAESGYDLALTERVEGAARSLLVEIGSERGRDLVAPLALAPAEPGALESAREQARALAAAMPRRIRTEGLPETLMGNLEHPRWDETARRCLACGNCTMVCPTCFCSTIEDVADLGATTSERWRRWDSCFNAQHSHVHGGNMRPTIRSRYRQWLTHKFAGWVEQFGTSGCVGCGRCITWCPAAIDVTEEIAVLGDVVAV